MGFLDTVKQKANALAADAGRAGKFTALQTRLVVLESDARKAERELGREAFALIETGELRHPRLDVPASHVREAVAEIAAKEAEIAALRGDAPPTGPSPASRTTTVPVAEAPAENAGSAGAAVEAAPEIARHGAAAAGDKPAAAVESEPQATAKPAAAKKRGAKPKARAARKPAAKPKAKPAAGKPATEKAAGTAARTTAKAPKRTPKDAGA